MLHHGDDNPHRWYTNSDVLHSDGSATGALPVFGFGSDLIRTQFGLSG